VSEGIAIFAVGKPTKDPQKVHFVTNFVTHLVSKWVFFLYINNLQYDTPVFQTDGVRFSSKEEQAMRA
jgi:hypothetical protein